MDYGMIGKIDKAKRYAQEKERFHFSDFTVTVRGENNSHVVHYANQSFTCDCDFFHTRGRCSHTLALEMLMEGMINGEEIK
jgi:hypothetical protein